MLRVDDLHFAYPDEPAVLRGVDLELAGGNAVGLLGANGSGKSTMLGAITDSIRGDRQGTIEIAAGAVGPLGFATQNVALYQHLSVRENLVHAARLATGRWKVGDLCDAAVDEYGLGSLLDVTARHLSGGQSRVSHLACSFVHQPSIRLLDEPTTALDFETRQTLVGLVQSWRDEGVAVLVTAHYPEDIEELCSELVVLVDGVTHALGSIEQHLRGLGTTASVVVGGVTIELDAVEPTLAGLVAAAQGVDVDAAAVIDSVRLSPPSLRDLLRRDPSLREAVTT